MASKAFRRLCVLATSAIAALALWPGSGTAWADAPAVETVGSPIRTATTLRLEGRVAPRGLPTVYWFEYGTAGPCDSNPCQSTPAQDAGDGQLIEFASAPASGLLPGKTYHYRLVAENGDGSGPSLGEDMVVKTRASDLPLAHGHFPGPPGSDRAWEQVNLPDTGGNPVAAGYSFSDSGERAIYQISGGTPISDSGSAFNQFFAERTPSGWQSRQILPPRNEVVGPNWQPPYATDDLSQLFTYNANLSSGQLSFWQLRPGGAPAKLLDASDSDFGRFFVASDDLTRKVVALRGTADPAHPVAGQAANLYDVGSGAPQLLSLMPTGSVAACGVGGSREGFGLPRPAARRVSHWLSPDGSLMFFPSKGDDCAGESQLYMRNIPAATTTLVSGPPVSGPACGAGLVKSTPGAVFFWSKARLALDDSVPLDCSDGDDDGDVYRYELDPGRLECVTCVAALDADVTAAGSPGAHIAVAGDGSRVYFASSQVLLPGATAPGAYRVDVSSGDLAYVAPLEDGDTVGDFAFAGNALTPDGSVLIFRSAAAALNQLGGAQNGGTAQYYRYDDGDRSLVCASCPQDGSPAPVAAVDILASELSGGEVGPNADPLSDRGDFVFSTPNRLLEADRNTAAAGTDPSAGVDLYEWRDGQLLLVSDGLTAWPEVNVAPLPSGVSPSGRDVFFTASVRYTPDALDSYNRLYDARIGGGIDFPEPPEACLLSSCQSAPPVLPGEPSPNSDAFFGPGNVQPAPRKPRRCQKGKRKIRRLGKVRCVKQARKHRSRR